MATSLTVRAIGPIVESPVAYPLHGFHLSLTEESAETAWSQFCAEQSTFWTRQCTRATVAGQPAFLTEETYERVTSFYLRGDTDLTVFVDHPTIPAMHFLLRATKYRMGDLGETPIVDLSDVIKHFLDTLRFEQE